jgi:hypothetical protein
VLYNTDVQTAAQRAIVPSRNPASPSRQQSSHYNGNQHDNSAYIHNAQKSVVFSDLICIILHKDFLYLCMRVQSRERAETWPEGMRRNSLPRPIYNCTDPTVNFNWSTERYYYAYFIFYITEPKTKVPLYYSRLYTESILCIHNNTENRSPRVLIVRIFSS